MAQPRRRRCTARVSTGRGCPPPATCSAAGTRRASAVSAASVLPDSWPNRSFTQDKWGAAQVADDGRWKYGSPPNSNANYGWIQHFIHHLAPNGRAGFVMANGSLTTNQSGEGKIREGIVREDLVDCIVACPGQLFYTTQIPVCLWFLDRDKQSSGERDRRGEVLFIDARSLGHKISRTQIEFTDEEIERIVSTYHAWRGRLTGSTRRRRASVPRSIWKRSRNTASRSRPVATSARPSPRRTRSNSRRRWRGSSTGWPRS